MKKFSLVTAILLLSSAWMLAQSNTAPSTQYPSSSPSTQQPAQQPDTSQSTQAGKTADSGGATLAGCIGGSARTDHPNHTSRHNPYPSGRHPQLGDPVRRHVEKDRTHSPAPPRSCPPT